MQTVIMELPGSVSVYDAVIAKAAELANVDRLITINEAHFLHVWPAGTGRIASPLSVMPP